MFYNRDTTETHIYTDISIYSQLEETWRNLMKQQKQLYDILEVNLCLELRSLIRNSSNSFFR